jgi:DNA-binding HxlR family transcriptional regulator
MRSSRLREAISPGLSYRTFSDSVRRLRWKGFVERIESPMSDGRVAVEYQLTDQGALVVDLLHRVDRWADTHAEDLPGVTQDGASRDDVPTGGAHQNGAYPGGAQPDGVQPGQSGRSGERPREAGSYGPVSRRPPAP